MFNTLNIVMKSDITSSFIIGWNFGQSDFWEKKSEDEKLTIEYRSNRKKCR